jgi:CRP-like cAMP-binding protein
VPSFDTSEMEEFIQFIQRYSTLTERDIRKIRRSFKPRVRGFYLKENQEITYDFRKEGNFITGLPSYLYNIPSYASVQALEDTELLVINYQNLKDLYNYSRNYEKFGRTILEKLYAEQVLRIHSFISETAQERYERLCREHPDLLERAPLYHIASYLGIKPESLSRLRRQILLQESSL